MKSRTGSFRLGLTALAVLTLSMASVVSHAQQDGGQGGPPPGGPGGQGGPGGGRGFGGQGGPGGGRIQPATAPVEVLTSELKLTTSQAEKIKSIQTAYNKERAGLMPGRGQGGPGGGGQGGPGGQGGGQGGGFDREAMQAAMQKMQTLDKTASDKIAAVLTDDQKAALPGVLQMLGALQSAGIQPQALSVLKLTSSQKQKAVSISKDMQAAMQEAMQNQDRQAMQDARSSAHDKIQSLLTSDQKVALAKYAQDHPQGRGGFGGPGGGGPGGQGGDGPPPPPDGNGPPPAL